jgi:glycerol-3-phosphate acyltransferase PlsX
MGGDYAPEAIVLGSILAVKDLRPDEKIVLFGDESIINQICKREGFDPSLFEIVPTTEVIGMDDHPAKAFTQKANSSITVGFNMLKKQQIDGFASAGSTGAMMVGAAMVIGAVPGIIRPVIAANMPSNKSVPMVLLDVGLNPDAKPEVLYQYGIVGSLYAQHVFGINNPRVSLLNIGSEENKGNILTKALYPMMNNSKEFNFVGNIEGHDFFNSEKADVVVCDGFVGNVVLKEAEAFYEIVKHKGISDSFFEQFNYENHGGTPVLGINAPVIIGHGISNAKAIKNMILLTRHVIEVKLIDKIKEAFK